MRTNLLLLAGSLAACLACTPVQRSGAPKTFASGQDHETAARTLDLFHLSASRADETGYFALLTEDAVFLGTDASERWTKAEFQQYAHPHFAKGTGWTYRAVERNVGLSSDRTHAWFDERLENAKLGTCRGSGVLRWTDGGWKIVQYNLTIPIPNDLAEVVVGQIRAAEAGKGSK